MLFANNMILEWLGFEAGQLPEGADYHLEFTHFPESWGVFVLLGIAVALFVLTFKLYRKDAASCPLWARRFLAVVRCLVLLVLLAILLGPAVSYTRVQTLRPVITLLRDASDSMNEEDRYREPSLVEAVSKLTATPVDRVPETPVSRTTLLNRILQSDDAAFLRSLEKRGRLRVMDFADRVTEITRKGGSAGPDRSEEETNEPELMAVPPLVAGGPGTDLTRALEESLAERLTSAVIAFTDGQHNAQSDPTEAAVQAKQRSVPLLLVGLGDPERPRNLQLAEIYADPQVWKNDPFEIQATLRAQGVEGGDVEVDLVELIRDESDPEAPPLEKILETETFTLPDEGGQMRLRFTHRPEEEGLRSYTVRVKPLENERSIEDNQPPAPVRVKVLDDKARVLMIAGGPNWEYRALTQLFTREENIDLSCWLQSLDTGRQQQGNTPIDQLPASQEALFAYDVVLMLDPDPREFDAAWVDLMKRFIDVHAGGLLYMPGPVFGGPFLTRPELAEFKELLPVTLGDIGSLEVSSLLTTFNRPWDLAVVPANIDQPIMRFYSDPEETMARWKKMPGIYWSFPATAAKPGARVLLEHSDPSLRRDDVARPLLVTGNYGAGRTTYLGFDGTWRWRTGGLDAEFFKRFWIQTTRFLIEGRTMAGKRRGVMETSRYRYEVGDRVRLTARLKQMNFDPWEEETVDVLLEVPGEEPETVTFTKIPNTAGEYEAAITAAKQGLHVARVTLPGENGTEVTIDTSFSVTLPIRERQETWLNKALLSDLAAESGGGYYDLHQLGALLQAVPDRVRHLETPAPPIPIWDTERVLMILIFLLGLEWVLRKRFRML